MSITAFAILYDPDNPEPASNAKALQKFQKAALYREVMGMFLKRIDARWQDGSR